MLDKFNGLADVLDKKRNSLLHIAAKLDSIPLSLSYIYKASKLTYTGNYFGNSALSIAIIAN